MTEKVKSGPPERGQARTRLARRAVIEAAHSLFLDDGYATTTIAHISKRADVPEPTVYRLFSSKVGILKALLDVSIAGDDQLVTVRERPNVAAFRRTRLAQGPRWLRSGHDPDQPADQ